MPESLLTVKKRLSTVVSIKKITKAMKLIAAARYTRWKSILNGGQAYEKAMRDCLVSCLQAIDFSDAADLPHCMVTNDSDRDLYVLITSTLGLCGSFNYDLFKVYAANVTPKDDVVFVGERGLRHFKDNCHKAYDDFVDLNAAPNLTQVNAFRHWLDKLYAENKYRSVKLIDTRYVNSLVVQARCEQLLPLKPSNVPAPKEGIATPLFDPNPKAVADLIVPHYLDARLYEAILESVVSEQASRRNSMDSATTSADKLIDSLKLEFNKMRQAKITQEITEIVSGANSVGNNR